MGSPQRGAMATAATHTVTGKDEHRGLAFWMNRVLEEMDRFQAGEDPDAVHDLRVALRRCRSVAKVVSEVDPHPAWRALRKTSKRLFRRLGALRDAQVLKAWTAKLGPANGPVRAALAGILVEREGTARREAILALHRFDQQRWRQLSRELRRRSRLVPPDSSAARCLALERYEEACRLDARASRSRSAAAWHALRIGIKQFRYTVELLLPERHSGWGDDLKGLQDLLGEVHDLDELKVLLRKRPRATENASLAAWRETIASERAARLREYRRRAGGKRGLWQAWRPGLPQESKIPRVVLARFRATAKALDPRPQRTGETARIARSLFRALAEEGAAPLFREPRAAYLLHCAAAFVNIGRSRSRKARHKTAQRMILELAPPPGWSSDDLAELAAIVRYHRGAEPKPSHRRFAELPAERRERVLALAGVLRLAQTLRRVGLDPAAPLRATFTFDGIVLFLPRLRDTQANAARVAAGKHLLETFLHRPILVQSAQKEAGADLQVSLAS
jgi:CHAD domain-containing protein